MKIIFLINANDIGGAEYVSYLHVKMAVEAGMDVTVLSGETGIFCTKIQELGVKVNVSGTLNKSVISHMEYGLFASYFKTADVVFNCNWFYAHKHVVTIKKMCGFKYFSILHSNIKWVLDNTIPYDKIIDKYYSINQRIINDFVKRGVSIDKFALIPNCVDTAIIPQKKPDYGFLHKLDLKISDLDLVIGMTTRIASDKNVLDAVRLIERVNMYRPASLVIIGSAPVNDTCLAYEARLKARIAASPVRDRIHLLGKMTSEQVYYNQLIFDVAINLSPSEGLPISMLEQMAAGIYCMYPSVGDIPNVLQGYGFVGTIEQRLTNADIHKDYNYTDSELNQWVEHLATLSTYEIKWKGMKSAGFVRLFRSYEKQKINFLKFLTS